MWGEGLLFDNNRSLPRPPQNLDSETIKQTLFLSFPLTQGFSTSALLTFWTGEWFVVGGCPVHSKMFSSIPGFYSLDASNSAPLPLPDNQKHLQTFSDVSWGDKIAPPSTENQYSNFINRLLEQSIFSKDLLFVQDLVISMNTKEEEEDKDLDHKKFILYPWRERTQMGDNQSFLLLTQSFLL